MICSTVYVKNLAGDREQRFSKGFTLCRMSVHVRCGVCGSGVEIAQHRCFADRSPARSPIMWTPMATPFRSATNPSAPDVLGIWLFPFPSKS